MLASDLGLCGGPVLIGTADVDAVVAPGSAVARVAVRAQHAANDVSQVGHVVHIRQRARDQNVPLACADTTPEPITLARFLAHIPAMHAVLGDPSHLESSG